mmetsp:Transcript_14765/g.34598  ORF Transcript_14765/g.34598 Transcript_14765/m.34598 type:complete len:311 (-) Transcript_14765:61-993(-)
MEEKLAAELSAKQKAHGDLMRERQEKEALARKLASIEDKLLAGTGEGNLLEINEQQQNEIARAQQEIEARKAEELRLEQELAEREEQQLMAEEKYSSIQEEVLSKTKKMKKLWSKWQEAKDEVSDLQHEFQQEREDLLETIREQDRQLKLQAVVIGSFIPPDDYRKIERRSHWEDDAGNWEVERQEVAGNNIKRTFDDAGKRPPSDARARMGHHLDDGSEDDPIGFSVASIPNVYFTYPTAEGQPAYIDEEPQDRPKSRARPASSKRPASARRSKSSREKVPEAVNDEGEGGDAAYPKARGMVKSRRSGF